MVSGTAHQGDRGESLPILDYLMLVMVGDAGGLLILPYPIYSLFCK
jgi:hypothetical protein